MASINFELPAAVHHAFAAFIEDKSLLALSLAFSNDEFQPLPLVHLRDPIVSFQNALNELDNVLNPRVPLYLLLRRDDSLIAITYVPYLAKEEQRAVFLNHRQELVRQLGEKYFSMSLICKEIGEITDARSWEERDKHMHDTCEQADNHEICEAPGTHTGVRDVGYKQNKCRLCDRRMKNKITPEALDALKTLDQPGATVQIVRYPFPLSLPQ
ncbi:Nn.00g042450.m01.CDS01 [Neocucurbitaria sp. VM-36]